MGKNINDKLASLGISATSCNEPGKDPSFILQQGEFEFGVGLHGEAGISRIKVFSYANQFTLLKSDHSSLN